MNVFTKVLKNALAYQTIELCTSLSGQVKICRSYLLQDLPGSKCHFGDWVCSEI